MPPSPDEEESKPGVMHAARDDGLLLPIIDVTNPAFAVQRDEAAWSVLVDETIHAWGHPRLTRLFLRILARRSRLIREVFRDRGSLRGMTTYMLKLGPDNLVEGYAADRDRWFASKLMGTMARVRLDALARLLADGLAAGLAARKGRSVRMLNIAGGPCSDSLNALLILRKKNPDLLADRRITIQVMDLDSVGPRFGSRALAALLSDTGPLAHIDVAFDATRYDWNASSELRAALAGTRGEVVAGSSEGGLFEYAPDDVIVANLEALLEGTPDDFFFVGSVVRDEEVNRLQNRYSKTPLRLFDPEAFQALVRRAGWVVDRAIDTPVYRIVVLKKSWDPDNKGALPQGRGGRLTHPPPGSGMSGVMY